MPPSSSCFLHFQNITPTLQPFFPSQEKNDGSKIKQHNAATLYLNPMFCLSLARDNDCMTMLHLVYKYHVVLPSLRLQVQFLAAQRWESVKIYRHVKKP